MMSLAVFGPMPETLRNVPSSSFATAFAICAGSMWARTPIADFGPTPETPRSRSNTCRASVDSNPKSRCSSSRTIMAVRTNTSEPWRIVSACAGVTVTAYPTPPTSITTAEPAMSMQVPRRLAIMLRA